MSATATRVQSRNTLLSAVATLGVGIAVLIAIFWPESQAAVKVWSESTAYGHCYLVVPIMLYLLWDRRDALRAMVPRPAPWAVLLVLPLPFAWLVAERLGIMEGRQLIAVTMLEVLFLAVLGWRMFKAISGPLLYLFFLVPFGMFLTPALQSFTAAFIDDGLSIIGIPHFITDMTIEIGAGVFYVAEACAGLRFLIASIAFGVFFALLNYNSAGRRAAFIVASIIIPVIANGFRALGIVVLGNILGSAQAAAADHIVYGWFFFSFVTLMLVVAGLPFRQPPAAAPASVPDDAPVPFQPRAAIAVLVIALLGPAAVMAISRNAAPGHLAAQPAFAAAPGCTIAPAPATAPDRYSATMTCHDRAWTIALQVVPPRSTGAVLAEVRRNLIGTIESEESVTASLPGHPAWQTITANEPSLIIAAAAWVDGQTAQGGLKQRLLMARDSLLGTEHAPAVMVLSLRPHTELGTMATAAAMADLSGFITAQPDLDATIAQITEQSGNGPQ